MIAALILWGHALAALAFGMVGVDQVRRRTPGLPQAALVVALFASACWALAVAGIDARDIATRLAEGFRDIAWLGFMFALVRGNRGTGAALGAVYAMAIGMAIAVVALSLLGTLPLGREGHVAVADARLLCRMMGAIASLVLVHHLGGARAHPRMFAGPLVSALGLALGIMWSIDLVVAVTGYAIGDWPAALIAVRGAAMVGVALLLGVALRRGGEGAFALSRTATMRSLSVIAVTAYAVATVALTVLADGVAGGYSRAIQTAIVCASTAALMTLLSTPWLRAWTKVKVAKHLFRHRYDYRAEWQRFTATLGMPGPGADPLDRRIVKAIADLTDSPAGLLLVPHDGALEVGAAWNWGDPTGVDTGLAAHLERTQRIVEIDAVRGEDRGGEAAFVPAWMRTRDEAWAIVPLMHGATLVGAILLARPPVARALDWEDLDLLRVAGRQAASYLAEDRAHGALADAQRFDEFNRRFAFIIHDIKNLVSGLALVARNAERHADNPEFRRDMIATLQDSVARMNALLARLSQHHQSTAEASRAVDVGALATRIAGERRAQHPVLANGAGLAIAQPGRLEQLLGHLVQNAIEASDPSMPVEIVVATVAEHLLIDVVDHGCGMAPGFVRDELFRPFASSKPAGFGIGAYEARQLAQAMGGAIDVVSRAGEGTRFRVTLPVAVSASLPTAAAVSAGLEAAA